MFIKAKDDGGGGDHGLLELQVVQSSTKIVTTNKPTSSFLQAGCPSCRPTNSVKALKGKVSQSTDLLTQTHLGVFELCLLPLRAPGYLGGGLPCLSSVL